MMTYDEIVRFHGHSCPGLAKGYRMALAALDALGCQRAADEELVALVENDACGVDALQCLAGCTFGKGNLRFRDYGKQAYTLYSRAGGAGVRVVYHGRNVPAAISNDRAQLLAWILAAPAEDIVTVSTAPPLATERAQIRRAIPCAACGEAVMETRLREVAGRQYCIPCAENRAR